MAMGPGSYTVIVIWIAHFCKVKFSSEFLVCSVKNSCATMHWTRKNAQIKIERYNKNVQYIILLSTLSYRIEHRTYPLVNKCFNLTLCLKHLPTCSNRWVLNSRTSLFCSWLIFMKFRFTLTVLSEDKHTRISKWQILVVYGIRFGVTHSTGIEH